ncbi:MAG: hypothetical protein H6571_08660 [Lewinellaceae bacterium]|nr:hypothetical protein [Lewinellaceae bacterium]
MRHLFFLMAFLVLATFCSCDYYYSDVPITDSTNAKIDRNLLGEWVIPEYSDSLLDPDIVIKLIEFTESEYLAVVKYMENGGSDIRDVMVYKVHHSNVGDYRFLNVQNIEDDQLDKKYSFWVLDRTSPDSVSARYITDTLENRFRKSADFEKFLQNSTTALEEIYLSESIPFYRWKALSWNVVNQTAQTNDFEALWLFEGSVEEDKLLEASLEELHQMEKTVLVGPAVKVHFEGYHLRSNEPLMWNIPRYGAILLRNGKMIKVKINRNGDLLYDMTNQRNYKTENKESWEDLFTH